MGKLTSNKRDDIGVAEYSRIVGLSRPTIYAYIKSGLITVKERKVTKRSTRYILSREEAELIRAEMHRS